MKSLRSFSLRAILLLPMLAVAACGDTDVPFVPPLDFANQPPIPMKVAHIQIVDEYVPPKTLPNVEHAAPTPPYRALRLWAEERLKTVGPTGYIRVGIRDASIVQKQLIGQVEYDGHIDVTLDADSGDGEHTASADIIIQRQVVTDNDKDLAEKERIWDELTRGMMADFEAGADKAIANNLGQFSATQGMAR